MVAKHLRRNVAFTLVELLVVMGIIAVLLGILIPVVSKAREAGNRTVCTSNLGKLGIAFTMLCSDHDFNVPAGARVGHPNTDDWVWWDKKRIANIGLHGVGPYLQLSPTSTKILLCPSDRPDFRIRMNGGDPYPFSYILNNWLCSNSGPAATPSPVPKCAINLNQIRRGSDTILYIEEDERTVDDGFCTFWTEGGSWGGTNLLAIRHDPETRKLPDNPTGTLPVPNQSGRGNVCFCDGHVEYVPRSFCHSKTHGTPDPGVFPTDVDVLP